ncbi:MAG: hypothetical protein IGS50_03335 [Synechococcales cyanobacterium C42_A2020_086]|nr:hypothetical protein [Synechococcales cyanobacterium C42_A2020_086]
MKSQSLLFIAIGISSALLGGSLALITHRPLVATVPQLGPSGPPSMTATAPDSQPSSVLWEPVSSHPDVSATAIPEATPEAEVVSRAWRDDQLQLGYDLNQLSQQIYQALHDPKAAALRALLSRQHDHCTQMITAPSPQVDLETQARCQALLHLLRQNEAFTPLPDASAASQP